MTRRSGDDRHFLLRNAKRIVVGVVGSALVIAGLFMLVLPGPGIITIVAGLAIMASEFDWAERWMHRLRDRADRAAKAAGTSLRAVTVVGIILAVGIGVASWYILK